MKSNFKTCISFIFIILFAFSCSSKKDIIYIQELEDAKIELNDFNNYILKVDDIIKIEINNTRLEEIDLNQNFNSFSNIDVLQYYGNMIDYEGYIDILDIGKVKAAGKSIYELKREIYKIFVESGVYVDPVIDIKLLNSHFTILGEVNKPGRHTYLKNNLSILQAIGIAGDLTINGSRKDVRLIRDIGKNKSISTIDLTSKNLFENDNFQIFSGDIIIVNPNTTRIKNAGIIGNSGTLVSLLSFLLSSIILITN